jgi:hypothetical protein
VGWFSWVKRRPTYAQALAQVWADIERDYPLDQVRAENRMREEQQKIAREERHKRLDGGGEYERGEPGLQ